MTATDLRHQLEKIDEQIIDLLSQRMSLSQEALEESAEALGPAYEADVLVHWEGAADERGWNGPIMGNICRWVLKLCKSGEE